MTQNTISAQQEGKDDDNSSFSMCFDAAQQEALLGHLIDESTFFLQALPLLKPEYFQDKFHSRIYAAMVAYYRENGSCASPGEIKSYRDFLSEDGNVRKAIASHVDSARAQRTQHKLDALSRLMGGWMKACVFRTGHTKAALAYNGKDVVKAIAIMSNTIKRVEELSFDDDEAVTFNSPRSLGDLHHAERQNGMTFGIDSLDKCLDPDAPNGALLPGDTTILLAPSGAGKTTCMMTVARHNLARHKYVLFLTHEGRPEDIQLKLLCATFGCTKKEWLENYKNDSWLYRMDHQQATEELKRFMTYIPYNRAGMTVEEVAGVIRKHQELLKARKGVYYDLIIDDYPAKLTCGSSESSKMQRRHIDEEVYNYFVQLALEFKCHVVCAIQTNREGSKKTKDKNWTGVLQMEDVLESWGPMTAATNVISINRDSLAAIKNKLTYHICKSRSSETGWSIVCNTDYARYMTHSNQLGSIWYRGTNTMTAKIDELMQNYRDKEYQEPVTYQATG